MPLRRTLILFLALLFVSTVSGQETNTYSIAIIRDGDSAYFDGFVDRFMVELETLADGNYRIRLLDDFNAGYEPSLVAQYLSKALADPQVDIVYAAGVIATEIAARLTDDERTKPIIGGALQFSNSNQKIISPVGSSLLRNYTFITSPRRVSADLQLLFTLSGETRLFALVDELYIPQLQQIEEVKTSIEADLGIEIQLIPAAGTASETIARLPGNLNVLYVSLLPRLPDDERKLLYESLAVRNIMTVTMAGQVDVELGALAGLATDESRAVARRTALNIHQLIQGVGTGNLPVYLPVFDRLVINAETARGLDWSPTYDIALSAELINEGIALEGEPISLEEAMTKAASENIDVTISREDQIATEIDVDIARTRLRPTLTGKGSYVALENWDRISPMTTPESSHQESLGLEIQSILFSDEAWSGLRAQRRIAEASSYLTLSSELDAMDAASSAYFDYLTAASLYRIERENLRLTENNFQLAKLRIEIGAAEPSESFRWEQSSARNRATLIQRESSRSNAMVAFNLQIGAPRERIWNVEDLVIGTEEIYFLDDQLGPLLNNVKDFNEFGRFVQAFAVENSPELLAFDLQLAGQGILLRQRQRRFMPEILGSLEYARVFQGSDFFATDSENQATLGVQLSIPIFENGQRKADVMKTQALIRGLAAQREKAVQQIEQRALAAFYNISSAHPNMRLSRTSLEAAEKNYESIQEKYSQGAASILDLLDAQSSLLSQRQQAAVAGYDYLKTVHQLQRAIAWYEYSKTPDERSALISLFRRFLAEGLDALQNAASPKESYREAARSTIEASQPN